MSWAIKEKSCSQQRACALVGMAPKVCRHQPKRPDAAGLCERLKELTIQLRRLQLLLRREGLGHYPTFGFTSPCLVIRLRRRSDTPHGFEQ